MALALLAGGLAGCSAGPATNPELAGAKASAGDVLRDVSVVVAAGKVKWFRVTTIAFDAKLTQQGSVPARLSAKHTTFDYPGSTASDPTLHVAGDGTERNWTLRVHNEGTATLTGQLLVTAAAGVPTPALDAEAGAADAGGDVDTAPPSSEIGTICDIDKTLLPPHANDQPLPAPYPGVAALLQALELRDGGQPGDSYFVTARSPERIVGLADWIASSGIPAGPIETGISGVPWVAEPEKIKDVGGIFDAHPGQSFVLFGDSNHRDPEVYAAIIASYGARVKATFIHKVSNISATRVQGMHLVDNYAQAAALLFGEGLLDESTARDVIKTAQAEGLAITATEIDALIDAQR